jgi:phosphatidate cytidylyltransferase
LKELLIRTITGISLIILVVGSIIIGSVVFMGINLVILGLGTRELYSLYSLEKTMKPHLLIALSSELLIVVAFMVLQHQWGPLYFLLPVAGWIAGVVWARTLIPGIMVLFWLSIPLGSFFALGYVTGGNRFLPLLPTTVIALVWINDTFAYLTGSRLGRHHMTPRLSPGKTWEGFAGGILGTMLGGFVISRITGEFTAWRWIILSILICLLALMGDLFESGLKRRRGVKDTGGILPGHGGILDRFDSLLFVAPVMWVLFYLIKSWP